MKEIAGLFFVGLPSLTAQQSGFFVGVGKDAKSKAFVIDDRAGQRHE